MKFIFVDNGMSMLVNFRLDIIKRLHSQGHSIIMCYPKSTHIEALVDLIPRGIHLCPVDCEPTGINPKSDIKYFTQLYSLYKAERPDLVFHYTIKPNIYGTWAAKLLRIKCVDMVPGLGFIFTGDSLKNKIGRVMYKMSLQKSNVVITLNRNIYDFLISNRFVKEKNVVLFEGGEGVDLSKYPYRKNLFDETRFLMVARVLYDKGYSEFVKAAEVVKKKYPDVSIELLGPLDESSPMGVPRSVLENDVKDGKITYLGTTNDVPSVLGRNGTCVVLPSYHEGLSRSLMEACAMARPIITSDIPGCRETVENGVNGFLVPVKNADDLAAAMIKFIEMSSEEKEKMADGSYDMAKRMFNISNVFEKYDSIIKKVLKNG